MSSDHIEVSSSNVYSASEDTPVKEAVLKDEKPIEERKEIKG